MTEGLKIAVVEDERVHAAVLIRFLKAWLQEKNIAFCIREFPDAAAFLFEWEQNQAWNALFLDIQMPGLNGMELAKKIRQENRRIAIVFVTGITDYLLEGYEVEALHYLMKPVDTDKISSCMERIYTRYCEQERQTAILTEAEEVVDGQRSSHVTLRLLPEDIG
ncbi:MAG: response regulator, partial [Lachnospiraceae bacterium]|nr:response regulator [Lachnospiraceae bacterium]